MPAAPMPTMAMSARLAASSAPAMAGSRRSRVKRLGRAEQGRGVQVAVTCPDALGQLPDQLLAGDGRVEGREAAHQLHHLDVAAGQVDVADHRLQAVAPGERHHSAVAQRLVQPAGGQVADPGQHLGLGVDLEDPGVGQRVAARRASSSSWSRCAGATIRILDDAQVPRLPHHAGHVGAGRPQDGGDVVLGAVVEEVQARRLGEQLGVPGAGIFITSVIRRSHLFRYFYIVRMDVSMRRAWPGLAFDPVHVWVPPLFVLDALGLRETSMRPTGGP